jgi:hypothetical protein
MMMMNDEEEELFLVAKKFSKLEILRIGRKKKSGIHLFLSILFLIVKSKNIYLFLFFFISMRAYRPKKKTRTTRELIEGFCAPNYQREINA